MSSRAFSFLERELGFRLVEATDYAVRYESLVTFVAIEHDRLSYEISSSVGLLEHPEICISIESIARFSEANELNSLGYSESASTESVRTIVELLAEILRKYGEPALDGDPAYYKRIKAWRNRIALDYTQSIRVQSTTAKAEKAWRLKDYQAVVRLFAPIQEWLSESQVKRLAYARKHQK